MRAPYTLLGSFNWNFWYSTPVATVCHPAAAPGVNRTGLIKSERVRARKRIVRCFIEPPVVDSTRISPSSQSVPPDERKTHYNRSERSRAGILEAILPGPG